jgi:hypothetical protein
MPTTTKPAKVECINPNTGGRMHIDAATYELFFKAICQTLKAGKALTFTQMVEGVKECFRNQKTVFDGSVEWYTVTIKNNMHSEGILEVYTEKGKKLHRLKS